MIASSLIPIIITRVFLSFFMARVLITTTAICFSSYEEWEVFLTVVIQSDDGYNNDNDEKRISGGIA